MASMERRLLHLKWLVEEQLSLGHLCPFSSPWNIAIFYIPKQNGKWRLLQDLWAVNAVIQSVGALQPELPSPTMIPLNWPLIILHLEDWFFYHLFTP